MLHCVHQLCLFTAERNKRNRKTKRIRIFKTQNYDLKVAQKEFLEM